VRLTRYISGLIVMLGVAMPAGALLLATGSLLTGTSSGVSDAFGGAIILMYIWGVISGMVVSLMHSLLSSSRPPVVQSMLVGAVLGLVAGAATPTMFTGPMGADRNCAWMFHGRRLWRACRDLP